MTPLRILRWAWKAAALVVFGLFVYLVVSVVQVLGASEVPQVPSAVKPAAAIVVMSPSGGTSKLSADDTARLQQAITLFQAHRAPTLMVTGADGPTTTAGREVLYLEQQGVAAGHIKVVGGSDDAAALAAVARLVGHDAGGRVIVVSDPLASLRLRATAAEKGLRPEISPATPPAASFWTDVGQVWRQASMVAVGRVFGF
jgi:uncharacterized SAM-binding protein YcdF (DUF218 family)